MADRIKTGAILTKEGALLPKALRVVGRVPESKDDTFGFNAGTGEYVVKAGVPMLWTTSIVLLSLWFLGVTIPYTVHGYIHVFLVLSVGTAMIPFFHKRSALTHAKRLDGLDGQTWRLPMVRKIIQ
jgi:hypothetical protein